MTTDNQSLPPLPKHASAYKYGDDRVIRAEEALEYGDARAAHARIQEREDIAVEFDRRAVPGTGFYELHEPAEIIRSMK